MIFQSSISALLNHSAFHTDYFVPYRVLSCAPTVPHSLPAIRLYLLIFPGQIADCIIVFLYLFRQTYPVYQILHFLIRFVKVCFCHNFSPQPHYDFLLHIRPLLSIPFPIDSFQRHVSGLYLPFLPVLMPLTVHYRLYLLPAKMTLQAPQIRHFFLQSVYGVVLLHNLVCQTANLLPAYTLTSQTIPLIRPCLIYSTHGRNKPPS